MSLDNIKTILTPNGYKAGKVYAVKPTDGTGDATVTRNTTKTRVNSSGLIESNAVNVLAPDYLNGVCPVLNVEGQSTNLFENSIFEGLTDTIDKKYLQSRYIQGKKIKFLYDNNRNFNSATFNLTGGLKYTFVSEIEITNTIQGINVVVFLGPGLAEFKYNNVIINSSDTLPIGKGMLEYSFTPDTTGTYTFRYGAGVNNNVINSGELIFDLPQITEGYTYRQSYIPTTSTTAQVTRSADTVTVPIPAGTTEIIEKYEDGTTNTITTIPASPYTVPVGRYEYILMR